MTIAMVILYTTGQRYFTYIAKDVAVAVRTLREEHKITQLVSSDDRQSYYLNPDDESQSAEIILREVIE